MQLAIKDRIIFKLGRHWGNDFILRIGHFRFRTCAEKWDSRVKYPAKIGRLVRDTSGYEGLPARKYTLYAFDRLIRFYIDWSPP